MQSKYIERASSVELTSRPTAELAARWDAFLWEFEAKQKKRRLGNSFLTRALEAFLDREAGGATSHQRPTPASIPPEYSDAVNKFVRFLQEPKESSAQALEDVILSVIGAQIGRKR